MTRAVFLDRDGVINSMWRDRARDTVDSPAEAAQFSLLPAVGPSIAALNGALAFHIAGHPTQEPVRLALEELGFFSKSVTILGVYPAHPFRLSEKS